MLHNYAYSDSVNLSRSANLHFIVDRLRHCGSSRSTDLGPLHMSPVDRAGSVTEMKFVSVHMVTFSPLCEMKIFEKVVTRPFMREI